MGLHFTPSMAIALRQINMSIYRRNRQGELTLANQCRMGTDTVAPTDFHLHRKGYTAGDGRRNTL